MKVVLTYLYPYRVRMLFGFLIKVVGTFMDLGLPWVLAYMIDDVIPKESVTLIVFWGIVMLALSTGARVANVTANRMASRVAGSTVRSLRHDLFWKIQQLSGAQVDEFSIPTLISRMTSDTYNIHQMVGMMQRLGVRAPIILFGGIIITATLEPVLTLVLIGILPILSFIVYMVSKKGIPLYGLSQKAMDQMIRTVRENINGIRIIKALSKTEYEKARFEVNNEMVVQNELKAGTTMALTNPMMNLLLNVGLTLVVVVGAYRVNSGASEPGKIVAFLSYFIMILNAVLMVNRLFVNLSKATASAGRIVEVMNTEEDLIQKTELEYPAKDHDNFKEDIHSIENSSSFSKKIHIEFQQVSFGYTIKERDSKKQGIQSGEQRTGQDNTHKEEDKLCVKDISFTVLQGESLGIIGSTGSGKTTLIHLLMRYYDIDKGGIYIHGKDIRTLSLQQLREKFGVVFQNDTIFRDTIKGNIDFRRGFDKEDLELAASKAQASEFIEELGSGQRYEYSVGIKGANLSGGQKQRLLVARALVGKPEILILDDSSSALDYKTDAKLRNAIGKDFQDSTILMVAQRISSIKHMNQIIVLEEGAIIGIGTHEELLQRCKVYQEIYHSQMGI